MFAPPPSYYVLTRQLMEGLANAVLAIFDLQKRIGKLSGLTARVDGLIKGIENRKPILQDRLQVRCPAGCASCAIPCDMGVRWLVAGEHRRWQRSEVRHQ